MKTARVILPQNNNQGESLELVINKTALKLCKEFGGATLIDAKGYWLNPEGQLFNEPVVILESAMDLNNENKQRLHSIGRDLLAITDQEAVYIQYADGEVEILEGD